MPRRIVMMWDWFSSGLWHAETGYAVWMDEEDALGVIWSPHGGPEPLPWRDHDDEAMS
ncbi:MAG TPA: hypothetical protein VHF89_06880 [Solirubrobacteraceae bacterium]|nr:hypothetical protein [Solirubrobacteraceae bacterium]